MSKMEVYNQIIELLTDNEATASNLRECFSSPVTYFNAHIDRYDEYGIDEFDPEEDIMWFGAADQLIENKEATLLDWKAELEDFIQEIGFLASQKSLRVDKEWFAEEGDVVQWANTLDIKWAESGYCVGAMDLDSDSYVLFVCKIETLETLMELGDKVDFRFDFAKNM